MARNIWTSILLGAIGTGAADKAVREEQRKKQEEEARRRREKEWHKREEEERQRALREAAARAQESIARLTKRKMEQRQVAPAVSIHNEESGPQSGVTKDRTGIAETPAIRTREDSWAKGLKPEIKWPEKIYPRQTVGREATIPKAEENTAKTQGTWNWFLEKSKGKSLRELDPGVDPVGVDQPDEEWPPSREKLIMPEKREQGHFSDPENEIQRDELWAVEKKPAEHTEKVWNGGERIKDDISELEAMFRMAEEETDKKDQKGNDAKMAKAIWKELDGGGNLPGRLMQGEAGKRMQKGIEAVYNKKELLNGITPQQKAQGEKQPGYDDAPKELQRLYDLLGTGNTQNGISFEELQKSYGRPMEFQMDEQGNVTGDYKNAFSEKITRLYPDMSAEEKQTLLDGSMLLIKAEYAKTQADPHKVIDVTNKYQEMVDGSLKNPFWPFEMLGFGPIKGQYYLKNDPQTIANLCGGQIPKNVMDEAVSIGGAEGVRHLQEQGYGLFRVGEKIMSPEELGNYSLGVIATATGNSRGLGYFAADADKGRMSGTDSGEIYDKYYQTMGMNDSKYWNRRP